MASAPRPATRAGSMSGVDSVIRSRPLYGESTASRIADSAVDRAPQTSHTYSYFTLGLTLNRSGELIGFFSALLQFFTQSEALVLRSVCVLLHRVCSLYRWQGYQTVSIRSRLEDYFKCFPCTGSLFIQMPLPAPLREPPGSVAVARWLHDIRSLRVQPSSGLGENFIAACVSNGALRQLTDLDIRHCYHFTDRCFELLGGAATQLQRLVLSYSSSGMWSAAAWTKIAQFKALRHLDVSGHSHMSCDDRFFEQLAQSCAASLRYLNTSSCSRTTITDGAFKHIAQLRELKEFHMADMMQSTITDKAFEYLATLPVLSRLNLSGCSQPSITSKAFEHLKAAPALTMLEIRACRQASIDDRALEAMAHFPVLHAIDMAGCRQRTLTDAGFQALSRSATLRELYLLDCNQDTITDVTVETLCSQSTLHTLFIGGMTQEQITNRSVAAIAGSASIGTFDIQRLSQRSIGDAAFEALSRGKRYINRVDMSGMSQESITDKAFEHLARISSLASLVMSRCSQPTITDQAFVNISRAQALTAIIMKDISSDVLTDGAFVALFGDPDDPDAKAAQAAEKPAAPHCTLLHFDVRGCRFDPKKVTDRAWKCVARSRLRTLMIYEDQCKPPRMTHEAFKMLQANPNLTISSGR